MTPEEKEKLLLIRVIINIQQVWQLECLGCGKFSVIHNERLTDIRATEEFIKQGWVANGRGEILCPECSIKEEKK